jgi:CRP-like cAMP-binding protein
VSNYAVQILARLGLNEASARAIAPRLVVASHDAGEAVWLQNQQLSAWCFIISGVVVGTSPGISGARLPVTLHGPESWFGELPVLNQEPTLLDYVCATDVQLIRMPVRSFLHAVSTDPGFSAHILKMMARRAQLQLDLVISLKVGSPIMRTILGLAQIAEALAGAVHRDEALAVPIKQSLVAAICGVSRTLLSQFLQALQEAGWVRVHYSRLELVRPHAWIGLARAMHRHRLFERHVTLAEMLHELELEAG